MDFRNTCEEAVITEVGPRDGLQSYTLFIPTDLKVKIINSLLEAGIKNIQITSFVNPKKVPQFKDAEKVVNYFKGRDGVFTGLVLNEKGLYRAIECGIMGVEVSISASDQFSIKNTGISKEDLINRLDNMLSIARKNKLYVRGSIQCSFGYLNRLDIKISDVIYLAHIFLDGGINELVFADTTAVANPLTIKYFFDEVLKNIDQDIISVHYHSKMNIGLVNIYETLKYGIYRFDTSFGYSGGCPFVEDRYINVSTEDAVNLFNELGMYTGIDLAKLKNCSSLLNNLSNN